MFNIENFDIKLNTNLIGRNFVYTNEIDSTNTELLKRNEFPKNGTVLLSEFQKNGRGRKDRTWISEPEVNLTFSILLKNIFLQKSINILNLGTALALAQTLENLYQFQVELKWPNDVLINKKKIAGILLESTSKGKNIEKLVVGIGVNVNQPDFKGDFNIRPTSIRLEFKQEVSRERFLSEFLNNFELIFEISKKKPNKILDDWKARCSMIGEQISIVENGEKKYGIFEDLDESGYLILRSGDTTEKISFGDVSLLG